MEESLKQRLKEHIDSLSATDVRKIKYQECGLCHTDRECGETILRDCKKRIKKYLMENEHGGK